jgi:apolipoprotein N-acyltransferase
MEEERLVASSSTRRNPSVNPPLSRARLALLLAIATVLLLFAMGRYTVALAAWLAPIFLLRYTRSVRHWYALVPAWLVLFVAWLFQFRGMVPLPPVGVVSVGLGAAFFGFLPYGLDRWMNRQSAGFAGTLVFPCAVAGVDFLGGSFGPYGSWCALGYSQYGNLPVMQLASITGLYGISFLVAWLGPVANWAWEHQFDWRQIRRGATIFGGVLAGVYLLGSARLFWSEPPVKYQRVVAIAAGGYPIFASRSVEERFWAGQPLGEAELTSVKAAMAGKTEKLLALSEQEAKAGARLVFWSEAVAWVLRSDEPALVSKGSEFASRNHVYLGMAINALDPTQAKFSQNKLVLIGPDGRVLFEYWKSRPVPGGEASVMQTNGNPMRYADTPLGRIGSFICFDLDFPALVRQAGRARVDLLIAPSSDWPAIDPWHTQMAAFRAVENGVNLVRDVSNGRSLAVDYLGRSLAETDYFTGARGIVAYIPTRGVHTLYASVGDLFAWLCIGFLILAPIILRRSRAPTDATAAAALARLGAL